MTNKEDEDSTCNPRMAALLAVHLVSQVLDEAYIIANAAKDSGQPWRILSSLTKLRSDNLGESYYKDLTYTVSKEDSRNLNGSKNNLLVSKALATSTPQKTENYIIKCKNETSFIGQGDEEASAFEMNHELRKSTSMIINNLFDMSDVERVIMCDEAQNINDTYLEETLSETIKKFVESYISSAVDIAFGRKQENALDTNDKSPMQSTENSSYSLLDDVFFSEIQKELAYYTENMPHNDNITLESDKPEYEDVKCSENENIENNYGNIAERYEDAYLTLNRDYEQYSEEEEPILEDLKTSSLQEVELITANTPTENVTPRQEKENLCAISGITTSGTNSRKSNLVRRCRTQGARLLSCLRSWWWRRKLLGKRKEGRVCGSIRGLCPLSPDARRRSASLLDQRTLRTPSPSRSVVWKFNTVNEALVHSSRWKGFSYKMNLNEND